MKVNDVVNGYRLVSEIFGGGMAQVFVVEKDGEQFALKTPKLDSSAEYVKRFKREARIMAGLHNDYILEILECDLDVVEPYYIMPFCENSLDNEIPRMSAADRVQACIDFTIGIKALHNSGIRHRDIKPANALLLGGQLKISDLGLGRMVNRDTTTVTTTMDAKGTYGYIPPEYYTNPQSFREGTIAGDIFMLGKSIYVICSGGDNPVYVDQTKVAPSIFAIIDKCTKLDPSLTIEKLKVRSIQKKDSVITIRVQLQSAKTEEMGRIKRDVDFVFVNGVSADDRVNDLFCGLAQYVKDDD